MKNLYSILIIALGSMFMFTACSEEEVGLDEGVSISGKVTYTDGNAAGAFVYIAYGTAEATTDFDQVTVADENGNYHFDGLNNGDYYVDAVYTNEFGMDFNTPGFHVFIGGASDKVALDIDLD